MARNTRTKGLQKAKRNEKRNTKKQQTETQKEYKRLRRNLLARVKYYQNKGYLISTDIVPKIVESPSEKSVQRLLNFDLKAKIKKAKIVSFEEEKQISQKKLTTQEIRAITKANKEYKEKYKETVKEITQKPDLSEKPYYPTISYVDKIKEALMDLIEKTQQRINDIHRKEYPFEDRWTWFLDQKYIMVEIFEDTITFYEDAPEQLEEYLKKNEGAISEKIHIIEYDSTEGKVRESFAILGAYLNGGSLSRLQAERISEMSEKYSTYEEYYED